MVAVDDQGGGMQPRITKGGNTGDALAGVQGERTVNMSGGIYAGGGANVLQGKPLWPPIRKVYGIRPQPQRAMARLERLVGQPPDLSGKDGITIADTDMFFQQAAHRGA